MNEIKIEVTYNGRSFVFNDGLKAYLFQLGVKMGFNENDEEIIRFIDKTYETVTIPNTTWVEDIAEFIANNWEKFKNFCGQRIFDRFVDDAPDGFEGESNEDYEDEENDEDEDDEND